MILRAPRFTLFPYTTLFRSLHTVCVEVTREFLDYSVLDGNDLVTPHPEFGFPGCGVTRSLPSRDRKSTRLNSSHTVISYAVFCLKKKKKRKKEHIAYEDIYR